MIAVYLAANFISLPQKKLAALGKLALSREQIESRADEILRERGFEPEHFKRVTYVSSTSLPSSYLLEHGSLDQLAQLFQSGSETSSDGRSEREAEWPDVLWHVRYFQILQREELRTTLDKNGNLVAWNHSILREAPGASLTREQALDRAKDNLVIAHHVDLENEKLASENFVQQEKRRDYWFTFERTNWNWGDSKLRTSLEIQGDEPVGFSRFVKVPEAWEIAHAKSGWKQVVTQELNTWVTIIEGLALGVMIAFLIRKHVTPWRLSFRLALFPLALEIINRANNLPWFFSDYTTTTPLSNYLIRELVGGAVSLVTRYLIAVVQAAAALGFVKWVFGWDIGELQRELRKNENRREFSGRFFWLDTLVLAAVSLASFHALSFAHEIFAGNFLPQRVAYFSEPAVSSAAPWLGALTTAFNAGYNNVFWLALWATAAFSLYRRFPKTVVCIAFFYPLLGAISEETWSGFAYSAVLAEVQFALTLFFLFRVWRFNVPLIFLTYAASSLISALTLFLKKGGPVYRWEALPIFAVCVAIAILARSFLQREKLENARAMFD